MDLSEYESQTVVTYCKEHLTGAWLECNLNRMSIVRVTGGLTNQLYRCSLNPDIALTLDEPREVLLRIYGPAKDEIEKDVGIFKQLAATGLGPKLYSDFKEGRFEEYLPSKPLTWLEMTNEDVVRVMAHKIAAIHKLEVHSLDKDPNWLIDKLKQFEHSISLLKCSPIEFDDSVPESSRKKATYLINYDFKSAISSLAKILQKTQPAQLVFSHNDLHQNNVILLDNDKMRLKDRVILIDFEYSNYNYRTFDIANHLSEWCFNYSCDTYPYFDFSLDRFPSVEKLKQFLRDYIDGLTNLNDTEFHDKTFSSNGNLGLSKEIMVETLFDEINPCLMACNLFWAVWAVQSALTSKITFGYWDMAQNKMDCYFLAKKQFEFHLPKPHEHSSHQNGG